MLMLLFTVLHPTVLPSRNPPAVKRSDLAERLAREEMLHTVDELIDDILDHVETPPPSPRLLVEDPDVDRQVMVVVVVVVMMMVMVMVMATTTMVASALFSFLL
jgi:hypothetical protein